MFDDMDAYDFDVDMDTLESSVPELAPPSQSTPATDTLEELQDLSPFNAYGGGLGMGDPFLSCS